MTKDKIRELLIAVTLGDGCIYKLNNYYYLEIQHSTKQEDYLKYKSDMLNPLFKNSHCSVPIISRAGKNSKYKRARIRLTGPWLPEVYELLYLKKVKTIKNLDSNYITKLSLFLLYLDDGSLSKLYSKSGKIRSHNLYISSMFDLPSTSKLIERAKKLTGAYFKAEKIKKKNYYRLRVGTREGKVFLNSLSEDFTVPNCMKYKFDIA